MSRKSTIRMLLSGASAETAGEWRRMRARCDWATETVAALRRAHKRLNAAWDAIFEQLPDDIDDDELEAMHIPDPPEQAEVDRIHAELDAVIKHDRWPRELYWSL